MFEKLQQMEQNYSILQEKLNQPETYDDPKTATRLNRELKELEEVVSTYRTWDACRQNCDELEGLLHSDDPELRSLAGEEFYGEKKRREALERQLQTLLIPKDPDDGKSVIIEVRAGVGGEEAALFAHSLCRMYGMYGAKQGWKQEQINISETELGGVKEAGFALDGAGAYARMKYESGVHRVQRVPETESGGRIHTSTATVAVLPEAEEVEFEHRPRRSAASTPSAPPAPADSTSTRPPPPSASPICPPAWWWSARMSAASTKTRTRPCKSCAPGCIEQERQAQQAAVAAERRSQVGTGDAQRAHPHLQLPPGPGDRPPHRPDPVPAGRMS